MSPPIYPDLSLLRRGTDDQHGAGGTLLQYSLQNSLLPKRNVRVEPCRAPRRQSRCDGGNDQKQRSHGRERSRVVRFDADEHAGHCARESESRYHPGCNAYYAEAQPMPDYKFEDASWRRAESHPDADLRRALSHYV